MPNTQELTSDNDIHWTRSDFENLQYCSGYDTSTNPPTPIYKPYPTSTYQKTTCIQDSDGNILDATGYYLDKTVGFTNPNLHRRIDIKDPTIAEINPNILSSSYTYYSPDGFLVYTIPLTENIIVGQKYTLQLWGIDISYNGIITDDFRVFVCWGDRINIECILDATGGHADYLVSTFVAENYDDPSEFSNHFMNIYCGLPGKFELGERFAHIDAWKLESGDSATPLYNELAPKEYELQIHGTNSYRTTTITVHDEESTTTEIP